MPSRGATSGPASCLIRQLLTSGRPEPRAAIAALNPDVKVVPFAQRLSRENVLQVLEGFDLVLDGGDNFPTRYLLNDACVMQGKPNIHGSISVSRPERE